MQRFIAFSLILLANFNNTIIADDCSEDSAKVMFEKHLQDWVNFQDTTFPGLIKQTSRSLYTEELEQAGLVYLKDETVETLENGFYIFLIDHLERLIISLRSPARIAYNNKFLATHLSLYTRLTQTYSTFYNLVLPHSHNLSILGAGEFRVINGQVVALNNRSGSWKGNDQNLLYSRQRLFEANIPFHPRAKLVDENNPIHNSPISTNPHFSAKKLAQAEFLVRSDPDLYKITKRLNALFNKLTILFPGDTPGTFNIEGIRDFLPKAPDDFIHLDVLSVYGYMASYGAEYTLHTVANNELNRLLQGVEFLERLIIYR
ncbi:MAG: hypothetical protein ISR65_19175 [Bacteriovoracaceae bacterium]|nr:hypothetical protein [Bacteriovoracaceae bacterium]